MNILLIAHDQGSHINLFPMGLGYIAAALTQVKHKVEIYQADVYHYKPDHLTNYLNNHHFDIVGLSAVGGYWQYAQAKAISEAINKSIMHPLYVAGGYLFSPDPKYFIQKMGIDYIICGEGEEAIKQFVNNYAKGTKPFNPIITHELIQNIDTIPYPAYFLFPMEHYILKTAVPTDQPERCLSILSGRGCPYMCNFCYHWEKGYRAHSPEYLAEHIRYLKDKYQITYITFQDDLFMITEKQTAELCEMLAKLDIRWDCQGRLNLAKPELLKAMKKSGCQFINWGIESVDDKILKTMNKKLTVDQIIKGVEATKEIGIKQGLNIIWGNIGETKEHLQKDVDFLLKYMDFSQLRTIRPVTPYPGSPLYDYAVEHSYLQHDYLSPIEVFYEKLHINSDLVSVNFTDLSDEEFHQALFEANKTLIEFQYKHIECQIIEQMRQLYTEQMTKDKALKFRGYREV